MTDKTMEEQAQALLEGCESVSLASVNEDGYPRICEMERMLSQGLRDLYFVTFKAAQKVGQFQANPKAGVGCCVGNDSISLLGQVKIVNTEAEKHRLLPAAYEEVRPHRDMTEYCILHFHTEQAKLFIGGKFETLRYRE